MNKICYFSSVFLGLTLGSGSYEIDKNPNYLCHRNSDCASYDGDWRCGQLLNEDEHMVLRGCIPAKDCQKKMNYNLSNFPDQKNGTQKRMFANCDDEVFLFEQERCDGLTNKCAYFLHCNGPLYMNYEDEEAGGRYLCTTRDVCDS